MDALIVVDMQVGLLNGKPKHDLRGVIERINRLAAKIRERSGTLHRTVHRVRCPRTRTIDAGSGEYS